MTNPLELLPQGFTVDQPVEVSDKAIESLPAGFSIDAQQPGLVDRAGQTISNAAGSLNRAVGIAGTGAAKGMAAMAGLPSAVDEMVGRGVNYMANLGRGATGLPTKDYHGVNLPLFPTTEEAKSFIFDTLGLPQIKPQTTGEQFLSKAAEGAGGGMAFGPLGVIAGVGSGLGEEAASQLTKESKSEIVRGGAPVAGALTGAVTLPSALASAQRLGRAALGRPQGIAADYATEGVRPVGAADVMKADVAKLTQNALGDSVGGATVIRESARRAAEELGQAVERRAAQYGSAGTADVAGEALQKGAKSAAERIAQRQSELYDEAFRLIGKDTRVQAPNLVRRLAELETEAAKAPAAREPVLRAAIDRAKRIVEDAGLHRGAAGQITGSGMTFETLRKIRTDLGKDLDPRAVMGSDGASVEAMRSLYGPLTRDIEAAAQAAGSDAANALKKADRYTRFHMTVNKPTINKIADFDEAEKAFNYALAGARDGPSRLRAVRRVMDDQTWGEFAGAKLRQMGEAAPGAQNATGDLFSVSTYLTNWNRLPQEAKNVLFDGNGAAREGLDRIARIANSMKDTQRLANTSRTAGNAMVLQILSGGSFGGAGAVIGGWPGAAIGGMVGVALPVVSSNAAARLMTNPAFVKWAATPTTLGAMPLHMRGLVGIANKNPEIAAEVREFLEKAAEVPALPNVQMQGARQ